MDPSTSSNLRLMNTLLFEVCGTLGATKSLAAPLFLRLVLKKQWAALQLKTAHDLRTDILLRKNKANTQLKSVTRNISEDASETGTRTTQILISRQSYSLPQPLWHGGAGVWSGTSSLPSGCFRKQTSAQHDDLSGLHIDIVGAAEYVNVESSVQGAARFQTAILGLIKDHDHSKQSNP